MKLLTIETAEGESPGVVIGDKQVLNISTAPDSVVSGWRPQSLREVLEQGDDGLERLKRMAGAAEANMESIRRKLYAASYASGGQVSVCLCL